MAGSDGTPNRRMDCRGAEKGNLARELGAHHYIDSRAENPDNARQAKKGRYHRLSPSAPHHSQRDRQDKIRMAKRLTKKTVAHSLLWL